MKKPGLFAAPDGGKYTITFILVTSLFLLWGLCNGLIDTMDKHFQNELHLTLAQSANVQFAHYLGYFLMSLPAGWLASKLGYKGGIIAGLLLVAIGGFWFIPATYIATFWAFLLGVCLIAAGLTFLETIANPYTTVLGPREFSATRINLAQSFNGIGWLVAPIVGSIFFYSKDAAGKSTGSETLWIPYACIGVVVLVLAVAFFFAEVPDIKAADEYHLDDSAPGVSPSIWTHPHFIFAVVAQFFYVAAQAGIFGFFINYLTPSRAGVSQVPPIPESVDAFMANLADRAGFLHGWLSGWFETGAGGLTHITDKGASNLAVVAFALFLLGRLIGAAILRKVAAHKVLGLYALANVVVTLLIVFKLGWLSVACVFLSYFFMSIMFPTIFALGIFGLGARAKIASAFIVMAIMGGALVPKLMGHIADLSDISRGFLVPCACFAIVALYGFFWSRLSQSAGVVGAPLRGGH